MNRVAGWRKVLCGGLLLCGRAPLFGRLFQHAARAFAGVHKDRRFLGGLTKKPWISPLAQYRFAGSVRFGRDVFIDDGCVLYSTDETTSVVLEDRVTLWNGTMIHCGEGATVRIGTNTHIQPRCFLTAFGPIDIGRDVQIAPHCAFYPYDHRFDDPSLPIREQPLSCRGGIVVEDDVWLGYGVTVLDGVRIGRGAVIAAGAVVTRSIPSGAIAAGSPARVMRYRPGFEEAAGV